MGWVPDHIWYAQKGKGKGKGNDGGGGVLQVLQSLLGGGGGGGWSGKGKGKGKGNRSNMQMISQTAKTNPEKVAWIGGLEGKTLDQEQCKKLKAHIEKLAGEGCKFVNITSKGAGGAIFRCDVDELATFACKLLD